MADTSLSRPVPSPSIRSVLSSPALSPLRSLLPALALLAGFAIYEPNIVSRANLWNIAVQTSYLAIFTLGQSLVILTAGLDLSIGMAVSWVSVSASFAMVQFIDDPVVAVTVFIVAGILAGVLVGAANGFLVAIVGVNPFVVTLGTFNILLALNSTVTGGFPVTGFPSELGSLLVTGTLFGVPVPIVVSLVLLAAIGLMLSRTVLGRSLYLIGSNPSMASVAGINVRLHTFTAYVLCSGLAACGAMLLTARAGSGEPNIGGAITLETFAAAVIGGTRLRGGEGGALAALVGAFFITVLSNGMNLVRIDGYIQQMCLGAIIILSLLIERWSQRSQRSA